MDLREWIVAEHASVLDRFQRSIVEIVPPELWKEPAGEGGSSIAFLAFHTSYHEDLAVNAVLRRAAPLLADARAGLGLAAAAAALGLAESEPTELTEALDLVALLDYVHSVHSATHDWISSLSTSAVDELLTVPDAGGPAGLERAAVPEADVPWLYRMWSGKPAGFFLQWEAIGHRINHLGEMVSVRNRLGLSPF